MTWLYSLAELAVRKVLARLEVAQYSVSDADFGESGVNNDSWADIPTTQILQIKPRKLIGGSNSDCYSVPVILEEIGNCRLDVQYKLCYFPVLRLFGWCGHSQYIH